MRKVHLLTAALAGLAALQAAATECGVKNTNLSKPFAGHWRSKDGELYDIAPGKITHSFTVHLPTGNQTKHSSPRFVADYNGETPDEAALDCRDMSATERDEIERTITNLAKLSAPNSEADRQNRQEISLFQSSTAHIPRPILAATHYEDWQWLILLSPARLLDVWYGGGEFSVKLYERAPAKNP